MKRRNPRREWSADTRLDSRFAWRYTACGPTSSTLVPFTQKYAADSKPGPSPCGLFAAALWLFMFRRLGGRCNSESLRALVETPCVGHALGCTGVTCSPFPRSRHGVPQAHSSCCHLGRIARCPLTGCSASLRDAQPAVPPCQDLLKEGRTRFAAHC